MLETAPKVSKLNLTDVFVDSYLEYRICETELDIYLHFVLWGWMMRAKLFQMFEDLDKYLKNLDSFEHVPINDISVV